jgi:hypothetical protein
MNSQTTWRWIIVALALFASILVHQRYFRKAGGGPVRVLPNLRTAAVTSVQIRPAAQAEFRVCRTNGTWQIMEPLVYPAQGLSIERFLAALDQLTPAAYLAAHELRNHPNTDEEYGFAAPQVSIAIEQPGYTPRLRVGARTTPGDQVFLQVVGVEGVYVVNADFLKDLPRTVDDWRDAALIKLGGLEFDRLAITNGAKILELRRDATNKVWRMEFPLQGRANGARVEEALLLLQNIRVRQFLPEDPKADLDAFGLQTPDLELALGQGTNTVARLQFGKNLTNDPHLVYARRMGLNAIVVVPKDPLASWYRQVNDFRDPFLVTWNTPVSVIDVHGQDNFSLQQRTNDAWRVLPQDIPADAGLVKDLLAALGGLQIVEFTNDVVTAPDLLAYGLAPPVQRYILRAATTNSPSGPTNPILVEVDFGTNQADKVFARRADEGFVYAVKFADFQRLPTVSWEMRDRQIWNFSTNDVKGVIIEQQGRVRRLVRNGPNDWAFAPGSQGDINVLAVEEAVRGLCQMTAVAWMALGDEYRARYGFTDKDQRVTLELKNGDKASVEFSALASPNSPYAAVTLAGQLWIFQLPTWLHDYAQRFLSVPLNL